MYPSTTHSLYGNHTHMSEITLNPIIDFPSHHPYIRYEADEALFLDPFPDFFSTNTNFLAYSDSQKMAADDEKCTKKIISEDQELAKRVRGRGKKKERHDKINTARGPRDRRMRLSVDVAHRFFGLQDLLGFDKPSKTLEWLLTKSTSAIRQIKNNTTSSNCGGSTSDQYYCKVLSGIDEPPPTIIRSASRKEKKKKKMSTTTTSALIKRELRDKARERARERTKEKVLKRSDNGEFKLLTCGQGIMDMDVDIDFSKLGFLENVGEDQEQEEDISAYPNLLIRGDNWPDPFFYQLRFIHHQHDHHMHYSNLS